MNTISIATQTKANTQTATPVNYKKAWVFCIQLNDGRYVLGTASNPSRRISAINSGVNKSIPEPLSVYRIVGIKEQTEERTLISVTKQLCDRYGSERILVV